MGVLASSEEAAVERTGQRGEQEGPECKDGLESLTPGQIVASVFSCGVAWNPVRR